MGIFGGLFQRKAVTSSAVLLREMIAQGGGTKAGVHVSRETAMQCVTAMACARVIAEGLAQVPFKLLKQEGRKKIAATDHPLYELLTLKPNDWQTAFELREQIALHLVFCGGAFVWLNRVNGRVVELLPFEPQLVTIKRDGWDVSYSVRLRNGTSQAIPASEMWHLRGPSWDGVTGLVPIRLLREAIGLGLATEEHGARVFSNGAQPGGILSTEKDLTPDQRTQLRTDWDARQGGVGNAFKTAILWGGLKWQAMAQQNDQAQFLETRRFQVEETCRGMRVLPIMVGFADKAQTFASAEQMFLAHIVHTMGPWYVRVEQSAAVHLLTADERKAGYYFKHLTNALMRGASQARADFYTKLFSVGALNPNDIRELEDMDPYDGGDTYRVPLNTGAPDANPADPADEQKPKPGGETE